MSAIVTLAVLVLAASLGSWALSQQLASSRRLSNRALLLSVAGVTCLVAAVGLAVYTLAQSWPLLTPRDVAPVRAPRSLPVEPEFVIPAAPPPSMAMPMLPEPEPETAASDVARPSAMERRLDALKIAARRAFHGRDYVRAAQLGEELLALLGDDADMRVLTANAYFMSQRYEEAERHIEAAIGSRLDENGNPPVQWLRFQWSSGERLTNPFERARVQQALLQNYPEHRNEFAGAVERNLVVSPHDSPPVSKPVPPRFVVPGPLLSEWSTTECVASTRAAPGANRFLDNECERAVALVFASCPYSSPGCNASTLVSSGWKYETQGVVLITATQRPLRDRLANDGPLIAPMYVLGPDERRRIRYLACPLTDPEALTMLREPELAGAERAERLRAALGRDACYARVLELSRAGRDSGRSPDALLARRA
jgi:hypothetical protein